MSWETYPGRSDFGIWSSLGASSNSTWVGCLSVTIWQSCNNIHYFCGIWDADEPCSVKTAQAPESSFTMSPRSTTVTVHVCHFGSNSSFFEVTYVHQCSKVDFLFLSLCFDTDLPFTLDFLQLPRWNRFGLLPFFVHCCLCIWYLHCLRHRNKLVYQIIVVHRVVPFACDVIFVMFRPRTSTISLGDLLGCASQPPSWC